MAPTAAATGFNVQLEREEEKLLSGFEVWEVNPDPRRSELQPLLGDGRGMLGAQTWQHSKSSAAGWPRVSSSPSARRFPPSSSESILPFLPRHLSHPACSQSSFPSMLTSPPPSLPHHPRSSSSPATVAMYIHRAKLQWIVSSKRRWSTEVSPRGIPRTRHAIRGCGVQILLLDESPKWQVGAW